MSFKKIMGTLSPAYGMVSGEGLFGQAVGALPMIAKDIREDREDKKRREAEMAAAGAAPAPGTPTPMKKGGKVKSASARADGCCIRGKTRA